MTALIQKPHKSHQALIDCISHLPSPDIDMDFGGEFTVSIDGGLTTTLLGPTDGSDLDYFFGVIDMDSPFTSITFDRTNGDGYLFDNVNYSYIPEPCSMILFGLSGLLFCRNRSK